MTPLKIQGSPRRLPEENSGIASPFNSTQKIERTEVKYRKFSDKKMENKKGAGVLQKDQDYAKKYEDNENEVEKKIESSELSLMEHGNKETLTNYNKRSYVKLENSDTEERMDSGTTIERNVKSKLDESIG